MIELLGGLEWIGSLAKVLCVYLLLRHLSKGRTLSAALQKRGIYFVVAVLVMWIAEGFFTGYLTIFGPASLPGLLHWTIWSRVFLYGALWVWNLAYILVFSDFTTLEGREQHSLDS